MAKNVAYILGKIKRYYPSLLFIIALGVITQSTMNYLSSFVGKFIIDILEAQSTTGNTDITPLLKLLVIVAAVLLIFTASNVYANGKMWNRMIAVRMRIITERVDKVMSMNY